LTNQITAKVLLDSVNEHGHRMTTFVVKFPRYILAELNTHRALSKNSASSRAKPFKTMLGLVETDPFIPVQWMKDHKGMQGAEYFDEETMVHPYSNFFSLDDDLGDPVIAKVTEVLEECWLDGRNSAVAIAEALAEHGLTKQIVNRVLEPFMMHEVVLTGTEWENFFALRCPQYEVDYVRDLNNKLFDAPSRSRKDAIEREPRLAKFTDLQWRMLNTGMADIHIMDLAEAMWDAYGESLPKQLVGGEWHMPYTDDINLEDFYRFLVNEGLISDQVWEGTPYELMLPYLLKVSAARCARISYKTFGEGSKIDWLADIKLHDNLLTSAPIHASPAEHQGKAMTNDDLDNYLVIEAGVTTIGVCRNLRGFVQYRTLLNNDTMR